MAQVCATVAWVRVFVEGCAAEKSTGGGGRQRKGHWQSVARSAWWERLPAIRLCKVSKLALEEDRRKGRCVGRAN
jgi:hypothetical protein